MSIKQMEKIIGILLTVGVVFSCLLVLFGGLMFLSQHANENMQVEFMHSPIYRVSSFKQTLNTALTFSSDGMIKLGIFTLVITQMIRVGLLVLFYIFQNDYWFTVISLFIFSMLIYSVIFQR